MPVGSFIDAHRSAILGAWVAAIGSAADDVQPDGWPTAAPITNDLLRLLDEALTAAAGADGATGTPAGLAAQDAAAERLGAACQRRGATSAALAAGLLAMRPVLLQLRRDHDPGGSTPTEGEAARLATRLEHALLVALDGHARASSQVRDTFLAVIAHDLRNPLGSMAGCLELLESPILPEFRRRRAVEIARRSVATIDSMVTALLEYTRSQLGQGIQISPSMADLAALCRDAVEETQAAYSRSRFTCEVPERGPATFDAARMRQVLTNLLSNAVHHGEPGAPIALRLRTADEIAILEVRNTGEPIPPDLTQAIFDPLVQIPTTVSAPHQRPATSLGLGLFITREIVAAHGGTIEVVSSAACGTTFIVRVPRSPLPSSRPEGTTSGKTRGADTARESSAGLRAPAGSSQASRSGATRDKVAAAPDPSSTPAATTQAAAPAKSASSSARQPPSRRKKAP